MSTTGNVEKIRVYLDQNVLDYIQKGLLEPLKSELKNNDMYAVIYTLPTLREISRIENVDFRNKLLDCLKELNAIYFFVDDNERANFQKCAPQEIFDQTITDNKNLLDIEKYLHMFLHKMHGGEKNNTFDFILSEQLKTIKDNFNSIIKEAIEELGENHPLIMYCKTESQNIINKMNKMDGDLLKTINSDSVKYWGDNFNKVREIFETRPIELNNIEPPNVIKQIWDKIEPVIKTKGSSMNFGDLFGEGIYKYYPNAKRNLMGKVNIYYNALNVLGYYPDNNLQKEKKFYPFLHDQQHVSHAIFSELFFTRDRDLMKKASAVYEHLNIGTKIGFIKFS